VAGDQLINVVDAATPPDYARLPRSVKVVLGYVGQYGCTPHVWSTDEARRRMGAWAPIWVPPQRRMTAETGKRAAQAALHAVAQYDYPHGGPVFFDIERHGYDADPAGARAALSAFRALLAQDGRWRGIGYGPVESGARWVAKWVTVRPDSLPAGWAGQQWHGATHGGVDLSVFRPAVFHAILNHNNEDGASVLDKDDKQWLVKQLGTLQHNLGGRVDALRTGTLGHDSYPANLRDMLAKLDDIDAQLKGDGGAVINIDALATSLAGKLGPDLAGQLVAALAAKLSA